MIKTISKQKQLLLNTIASFIVFFMNILISFFLTPYITESVGAESYGFVGLANNFVNYATILTIALNAVAGRFISIEYYKGNKDKATKYLSSVFYSNLFLAIIIGIISIFVVANLEHLINISPEIVLNVKILFAFIIANFIVSIISTVFSVSTFITNKLYLSNLANMIGIIIRVISLFMMFYIFSPIIYFVGISSLIASVIVFACNIYFTRVLTPDIKVSYRYFSLESVKTLLAAGIWSSITKLSQVLSDGLDLLISNLFINALAMGMLSIAKTISTLMGTLLGTLSSLFAPNLTLYYSKGDKDSLLKELKMGMKFTGFFSSIVFCVFVLYGEMFFELWVPKQDTKAIYILALLSIQSALVSGVTAALNNVFLIVNKLKVNSIFWLVISGFDIEVVFILLNTTNLGVYAVAAVSTLVGAICNVTFLPMYASHCLETKAREIYKVIARYFVSVIIMLIVMVGVKIILVQGKSWVMFIFYGIVNVMIGVTINSLVLLNKEERQKLFSKILKLKKKGEKRTNE